MHAAERIYAPHTFREIRELACGRRILVIPDYQVKLAPGAPYHRRGAIDGETACGAPIDPDVHVMRGYTLDDQLCPLCHSPHELALGAAEVAKRKL